QSPWCRPPPLLRLPRQYHQRPPPTASQLPTSQTRPRPQPSKMARRRPRPSRPRQFPRASSPRAKTCRSASSSPRWMTTPQLA
ncbi:hypothetical protein BN1708_016995, partial [Verticillium longisporum]